MNFQEEFKIRIQDVEQGLTPFLPKVEGPQKILWEAMNYSVLSGGKRIRPIFMYETFQMFGGKDEQLIRPFMAALELIHTYSLVHDDLPAMDNDDYRRGRYTTHKKFGEDMGILAGDALLNYAFETATDAFACIGHEKEVGQALRIMAKKAGGYGMIGGQVVDVISNGKQIDQTLVNYIHKHKTAALLEASMMVGAILAGASKPDVQTMENIAYRVGMAFQIQDDLLDVYGDEKVLGKPVHSDEENEKTTYATLVGVEEAKREVQEYSDEAIALVKEFHKQSEFIEEMITFLIHREQ